MAIKSKTVQKNKETLREFKINKRPKHVFHTILESTGGIQNLKSGSQKPKDMQQEYKLKRKESNEIFLEIKPLKCKQNKILKS